MRHLSPRHGGPGLSTAPASAQQPAWQVFGNPPSQAAACPVSSGTEMFCLVTFCAAGRALVGILQNGLPAIATPARIDVSVDGDRPITIPLIKAESPGNEGFGAPLDTGEGPRLLDALMAGSSADLSIPTVAGEARYEISLSGSARALGAVTGACPGGAGAQSARGGPGTGDAPASAETPGERRGARRPRMPPYRMSSGRDVRPAAET